MEKTKERYVLIKTEEEKNEGDINGKRICIGNFILDGVLLLLLFLFTISWIKGQIVFFEFICAVVIWGGGGVIIHTFIGRLALQYVGIYYLTKDGIMYYYPWDRYERYILWEKIERIDICYLEWNGLLRERTSIFRICKKGSGFEQQYPRTRTSDECSRDIKYVFVISCTPERLEEMKHFYPKVNDNRSEEKDPWISQKFAHRKKMD